MIDIFKSVTKSSRFVCAKVIQKQCGTTLGQIIHYVQLDEPLLHFMEFNGSLLKLAFPHFLNAWVGLFFMIGSNFEELKFLYIVLNIKLEQEMASFNDLYCPRRWLLCFICIPILQKGKL